MLKITMPTMYFEKNSRCKINLKNGSKLSDLEGYMLLNTYKANKIKGVNSRLK